MDRTRRVFTNTVLEEALKRDGAVLRLVPDNFTSMSFVSFECRCGEEGSRRLDVCVDFGAFCEECARSTSTARRLATLAAPLSIDTSAAVFDLFTERDQGCVRYSENDKIHLALAPRYRKPYHRRA